MKALAVESVWKYYGDYPALRDIAFDVHAGQCLALLGRNGAGKTTLLRILAGLSRPTKGRVRLFEKDHADRPGIGQVGQNKLFFAMHGVDLRGRIWPAGAHELHLRTGIVQ